MATQGLPLKGPVTAASAISQGGANTPWKLTGIIDGGVPKIFVVPGKVGNIVPTIGGTSMVAFPAPALTVAGASGVIYLEATVDANGIPVAVVIKNAVAIPDDTPTEKHNLIGTWTSSGGVFTSVNSILNTNQALYVCDGAFSWYS